MNEKQKSANEKREILYSLVQRYGHREPKIIVSKAKERGLYHLAEDDKEIYTLIETFAKFHNLPFGYNEPPKEVDEVINIILKENIDKPEDTDPFYAALLKEHSFLSKKLLAINKLIELYKYE